MNTKQNNMDLKKDWKFYTGVTFLILSCILPLIGLAIPFFDIHPVISVPVAGFLMLGGPEIMIIIAASFLGKNAYHYYRNKFLKFFKRKKPIKPHVISATRYYVGLSLFFGSLIPMYLNGYAPQIMPKNELGKYLFLVSADLVFVISFFVLGADFWEKYKSLFIWQTKDNKHQK
jgi:hypothetical protein